MQRIIRIAQWKDPTSAKCVKWMPVISHWLWSFKGTDTKAYGEKEKRGIDEESDWDVRV